MSGEEGGAESCRRLQRLELPWLDLPPPHAHPPAHGRALWETELIGVGTGLGGVLLAASCPWPSSCSGARGGGCRRRCRLARRPTCRTSSRRSASSPRRLRAAAACGARWRSATAPRRRRRPRWSPRASLLAVGAALRMERRGSAPGVGTPRSKRRQQRLPAAQRGRRRRRRRHRAQRLAPQEIAAAAHAPPDAHPVARPQVVAQPSASRVRGRPYPLGRRRRATSTSPSCRRSARPRRRRRCRRCASCSTPSGRTCARCSR